MHLKINYKELTYKKMKSYDNIYIYDGVYNYAFVYFNMCV